MDALVEAVITTALWDYTKPDGLRAMAYHGQRIMLTVDEYDRGKRAGVFDQPTVTTNSDPVVGDPLIDAIAASAGADVDQPPRVSTTTNTLVATPSETNEGPLEECLAALIRLDVPTKAGGPTARDALRADGQRFGNDVIAAAVKARKSGLAVSGTVSGAE